MNQITRADAIVVLLFFMVFLYYLITLARAEKGEEKFGGKAEIQVREIFWFSF